MSEKKPTYERLTEDDLENLSGTLHPAGPNYGGTPWSRIMSDLDEETKSAWRANVEQRYSGSLGDEEMATLKQAFDSAAGVGVDPVWGKLVDAAPDEWKDKWRAVLKKED